MLGKAALSSVDKFVTMGVGQEVFALGVEGVREILDIQPMAALPNAPAFLLGIIDVRGQAVPIVSLARRLSLAELPATEHTRIVVLEVPMDGRLLVMGVVADRVFEVTALDENSPGELPDIGIRWKSDYIRAIGRRSGQFVIVFDLERLFTTDEAAFLETESLP